MNGLERFFAYSRERHQIYLNRAAGKPRPWTDDAILRHYRFCNIYRELDKVTTWFRANVRAPLSTDPNVFLATLVFRMFNRISTGEAIFLQRGLFVGQTAWDVFLNSGDVEVLKAAILSYCGQKGPFVTGAYIVKGPMGMPKLDGVLWVIEQFYKGKQKHTDHDFEGGWYDAALHIHNHNLGLQWAHAWFESHPYIGRFTAYEFVTDLRYTMFLENAPDILTWANPGPGARRGLNRIHNRPIIKHPPREQQLEEMRQILKQSRSNYNWPKKWPRWEMREVEHTLCEFDKYERTLAGEGRPRGVFAES